MENRANKIVDSLSVHIPLTVPASYHEAYRENYLRSTYNSGRLFLFAGDQKIEHLNSDFYGDGIPEESADPRHLFEIACQAKVGAFATQLGLISHYGNDYKNIRYVVKLNAKSNLVTPDYEDPISLNITSIDQVAEFKNNSGLDIVGVGYTLYLGSKYEAQMISQAAQAMYQAHKYGLLGMLWIYPRGKAVTDERDANLIAGAAGVAVCLGADFVKINAPHAAGGFESAQLLKRATVAAGRTGVICSGGSFTSEEIFLNDLYHQIHIGGTRGVAIGRNVHQRTLAQALKFCDAISAIVVDDLDVETAKKLL